VGGGASASIDEIKGLVQSIDEPNSRCVIDGFADGDQSVPLGAVTVQLNLGTALFDDNGVAFPTQAGFFAALSAGTTLLEVHGGLQGGTVNATRVEVEDDGVGGPSYVVKIDGRITNLDTNADTFDLEIIEIEKGSAVASPVIGIASQIAVSYTGATGILLEDDTPTTEASLSDGQRVKVKFPAFVAAPFAASRIELEDQPEFEGHITSIAGLPASITMHLESNEPAIASGQVLNSTTDVTVNLLSSTLFLDTDGKPTLTTAFLQPGLKLEVHGAISGPSTAPPSPPRARRSTPADWRATWSPCSRTCMPSTPRSRT
jgi:hypothetical protein